MTYKDYGLTKAERNDLQWTQLAMRPYLFAAKKARGITACEHCGGSEKLEFNHTRYGSDITLNDLELLCSLCHDAVTFNRPRKG
jgi:hypothetical protein